MSKSFGSEKKIGVSIDKSKVREEDIKNYKCDVVMTSFNKESTYAFEINVQDQSEQKEQQEEKKEDKKKKQEDEIKKEEKEEAKKKAGKYKQ